MRHLIIVKFNPDFNLKKEISEIQELFNKAIAIKNIKSIKLYQKNIDKLNRYDLMIEMYLSKQALDEFDNSNIHKEWKEKYGKYIENKTIFDCEE